jgi:MinD-like ATPase involved in chromosome partitioning or flagellar assembly
MRTGVVGLGGGVGTSTVAALLLATSPANKVLGIEADPDGGVWAARFGLSTHESAPTLRTLLTECRALGDDPEKLWSFTQLLWGSVGVVVTPSAPYQAQNVVNVLVQLFDEVCALLPECDVVLDLGRWRSTGSSARLATKCDAVVVVIKPDFEHLEQLSGETSKLLEHGPVGVVVHGTESQHSAGEVAAFVESCAAAVSRTGDMSVIGVMSHDPKAMRLLHTGGSTKALQRSALVRSIVPIANAIDSGRRLSRPLTVADVIDAQVQS